MLIHPLKQAIFKYEKGNVFETSKFRFLYNYEKLYKIFISAYVRHVSHTHMHTHYKILFHGERSNKRKKERRQRATGGGPGETGTGTERG